MSKKNKKFVSVVCLILVAAMVISLGAGLVFSLV